ncbi:SDCBP [Cordylochernes scorpioides]|uniref:SDCBP n=1 Tax=Cordylochernes scorpioides TaxID=51811 RepID=A0ABY6LAH4_9ARAC|nr:SDCBP [Cordylochernes scorpioides]
MLIIMGRSRQLLLLRQVLDEYQTVAVLPGIRGGQLVAPLSSQTLGLARAQVNHGIREVILCKDQAGKVGLRMQAINKGVFVVLVQANSPAALAGLRFGDQILQINDTVVAGFTMTQVHDLIRKANPKRIVLHVRDRPFERTVTMHKDSIDTIGFVFKNGKIISLVKDSSAARNGLLTDHQLLEHTRVNGQNVVGIKDSEITKIIREGGNVVTVTIMPSFIYDHMMKFMATSIVKKLMDHSIPDL